MSIKFRVPLFPFLHVELRGGPCDTMRVELHSPRVEIPLVLLWLRPSPSVRWATADELVSCVADAIDAYRLTQDDDDDGADDPDPDGWRDVSEVTLDEWLACPWWEWRYSATAGHARKSSRETKSLPVLGQVRRVAIQGDETLATWKNGGFTPAR